MDGTLLYFCSANRNIPNTLRTNYLLDMYDNYVKLQIEGLTRGSELQDAFILVLSERENEQFLPILVNHEGYLRLKAALHDGDYTPTKLMNQLARRVGMTLIGVRIMAPKNGETNALIDFELINEVVSISVPVADAVIAALETKADLWTAKDNFFRQHPQSDNPNAVALPLSAMNEKLLREALEGAVEEENFELAGILRDELKKREQTEEEKEA